jgi:hypothetical protein
MSNFDLYAAENEPLVMQRYETYVVTLPSPIREALGRGNYPWVFLNVYEDGLATLDNCSSWFNEATRHVSSEVAIRREIWEWLVEWELVELKPIGPEDWEYFITSKFLNRSKMQ